MRRVSIFGSTGSVGANTVQLIASRPDEFDVAVLSGGNNIALLAEQARHLKPDLAVTSEDKHLPELRALLSGSGVDVAAGRTALVEAATRPCDWAMSAIVGFAGLEVSLALARASQTLALANKESLVSAGALLKGECEQNRCCLLPVDSEHAAIFQLLEGQDRAALERLILTASGGPFRTWSLEKMRHVTVAEALAHPNWVMGARISIDSASMFNKAMEMLEAQALFDVAAEQIEVVVHPQSLVHSLIGFCDGALLAHLGPADMQGPIQFALDYPLRKPHPMERLDLAALGRLEFEPPDETRFPALRLARETMKAGPLYPTVFNAAKEAALDLFLAGNISFLEMARHVEAILEDFDGRGRSELQLEDIVATDRWARHKTGQLAGV